MNDADQLITLAEMHPDTPSVDLHGMTVYEAEHAVDAFLSSAATAKYDVVKIIHGKGQGRLQEAMRGYVPKHPIVRYARSARGSYEIGAVIYAVL